MLTVINAQCTTTNVLFSKLFIIVGMTLINVLIIALGIQPTKITVTALNDVTLTCIPQRGTPDGYSWHRVDGDIPPHSSGQNTSTLTIHRIVPADEGEYYCMAALHGHCAKSNKVTVRVNGKETIVPHMYYCLTIVTFNYVAQILILYPFRHAHIMLNNLRNNGIKRIWNKRPI